MASPSSSGNLTVTPRTPSTAITTVPDSCGDAIWRIPFSDEAIWKRLKEAGFVEESIKRRDKASLIAYIAKLEAEIQDVHYQIGLLLLEKKEWVSKFDQIEATADAADLALKRERAARASDTVETKKREDALRKALGIEKECVANIEKALHEIRAESAEAKVSAEIKFAEARSMMEDAVRKFTEAEAKLHAAQPLEAEASRLNRVVERKLREVEEREDDLSRQIFAFKSDCDAKESEIQLERQSVRERQKALHLAEDRLLEERALFNQREENVVNHCQALDKFEQELKVSKSQLESQRKALNEEKHKLELMQASLEAREEVLVSKECEIEKKDKELLILQRKHAITEREGFEQAVTKGEATLTSKKSTLEAEFQAKHKSLEEEIERKRRYWELKEMDLKQLEEGVLEKEYELIIRSRAMMEKEKESEERFHILEEKETSLTAVEEDVKLKSALLQRDTEEIENMKLDLQKGLHDLEEKKKQISSAEEKVVAIKNENDELLVLWKRLKEEIDEIRAHKLKLEAEAEKLNAEKAQFETEWDLVDEKREELRKEAERVAEERLTIYEFLKSERDSLDSERDAIREQCKLDLESLSRDREAFHSEMERDRSDCFRKIEKEREDFSRDIAMQRNELENCIDWRRKEMESDLNEQKRAFEEEKKKELEQIASLKEILAKEMEFVNLEMRRLETERKEVQSDRDERDKERAELNKSIEELKLQQQKLEKQREFLHADRGEILFQIEELKKLEDVKDIPDRITLTKVLQADHSRFMKKLVQQKTGTDMDHIGNVNSITNGGSCGKEPDTESWLKLYADTLVEQTQGNKRRRQEVDGSSLEGTRLPSALATEEATFESDHAAMPTDRIPEDAEETTVYIDKIVTVEEVTSVDIGVLIGQSQGHSQTNY